MKAFGPDGAVAPVMGGVGILAAGLYIDGAWSGCSSCPLLMGRGAEPQRLGR